MSNPRGSRAFKREVGSGFGRAILKKRKGPEYHKRVKRTFTHKFVCLNKCAEVAIPTLDREKDRLLEAGLGEKKITIPDIDCSVEEFRDVLFQEFPKLKDGGGFIFAKCQSNSRSLDLLSPLCVTSPRILRDRVGNSRTYILPMQRNLSLLPVCSLPSGVSCVFIHF